MNFRYLIVALSQLSILALLASTTVAARAEWVEVDNTYPNETTYIDPQRIRRESSIVFYWTLSTFKEPRLIEGRPAMSRINQSVVDCQHQVQATIFFAWYQGPNGTGANVNIMNVPLDHAEFHPIVPTSIGDREATVACHTPSQMR